MLAASARLRATLAKGIASRQFLRITVEAPLPRALRAQTLPDGSLHLDSGFRSSHAGLTNGLHRLKRFSHLDTSHCRAGARPACGGDDLAPGTDAAKEPMHAAFCLRCLPQPHPARFHHGARWRRRRRRCRRTSSAPHYGQGEAPFVVNGSLRVPELLAHQPRARQVIRAPPGSSCGGHAALCADRPDELIRGPGCRRRLARRRLRRQLGGLVPSRVLLEAVQRSRIAEFRRATSAGSSRSRAADTEHLHVDLADRRRRKAVIRVSWSSSRRSASRHRPRIKFAAFISFLLGRPLFTTSRLLVAGRSQAGLPDEPGAMI